MITLNICLSDIPKAKIYKAKDGKSYINLVVTEMRQPDKVENTHTCYISQSKEEKGQAKTYIGKGREIQFAGRTSNTSENFPDQTLPGTDLPF